MERPGNGTEPTAMTEEKPDAAVARTFPYHSPSRKMNAGRTPVCYLLCENGGRASIQRVQWAIPRNPNRPLAATRPPGTTIFVLRVSELCRGEARFQNASSPASRKSMRHWKI